MERKVKPRRHFTLLDLFPGFLDDFVAPEESSAKSYKIAAYIGVGGFKFFKRFLHLNWDSTFISFEKKHPKLFYEETFNDKKERIYINTFTDQRYSFTIGNEFQWMIWKKYLGILSCFSAEL